MSVKNSRTTSRYSPYQVREDNIKNESKSELRENTKVGPETKKPTESKTQGEVVVPSKTPPPSSPQDTSPESTKESKNTTHPSTSQSDESHTQLHTNGLYQSHSSTSDHYNSSSQSSAYLPPSVSSRNAYSSSSTPLPSSYLTTSTLLPTGPPQPLGASRVIHFRNVGASITKEDLLGIASPFGVVDQVVLMRSKNQALCQMQQLEAAVNLMEFYTRNPCAIRGKRIYLGFSRHQGLAAATPVNRIVLVTMQTDYHQSLFPYYINTDVIKQIFSTHGYVEKIVIITKPDKDLQSLVQFSYPESAVQAMHYLNTQTIYLGSDTVIPITLDLQFSNLTELTVKQNCEKSRDYSGLFQPPATYPAQPAYTGQLDQFSTQPGTSSSSSMNQQYDYSSYYQM